MYKQQNAPTILINISNAEIFFPLTAGKIKKVNVNAKPKCIALAGKPLNIPKLNQKGNGDAYQSWNKDQIIAILATIFKWIPSKFFVGDKSSWILFFIFEIFSDIKVNYNTIKKGPINILGLFDLK